MEKEDFEKMDKQKKVDYINENLREGMSFKDIYENTMHNNELSKSREILLNQFRKAGYRVNEKPNHKIFDKPIKAAADQEELPPADSNNNYQLEYLLKSSDDIMHMLEWWKNNNAKPAMIDDKFAIQIPDGEDIRNSLRINNHVWDEWKAFCNQNPGFSEKDLLAKALLSFIRGR